MREFPKIRKTVKWGGLAVAVLLGAAAVRSGWVTMIMGNDRRAVGVLFGCVYVGEWDPFDADPPVQFRQWRNPFPAMYFWSVQRMTLTKASGVFVPAWMPCGVLCVASALAWRLDTLAARRQYKGRCGKCGYDRAGLSAASPCPECGAAPVAAKTDDTFAKPTSPES